MCQLLQQRKHNEINDVKDRFFGMGLFCLKAVLFEEVTGIGCPMLSYIYKIGGGLMSEKDIKDSIITGMLCLVLAGIVGLILSRMYGYYKGPDYVVDCYVQYLNERSYDKLYPLLEKASTKHTGGAEKIEAYYKKVYEKEQKLQKVEKKGVKGQSYKLRYYYPNQTLVGKIEVVKEKGHYKIRFPFAENTLKVFAPLGAKVYLESTPLDLEADTGCYTLDHVLPGNYLLTVRFIQKGYKDYFKVLHMPEEQTFEVPYETACVKINCAPHLKVALGPFSKESTGGKVTFNDMLLEQYAVKVFDEAGYFVPQEGQIKVTKGGSTFNFRQFELSKLGEQKLQHFIEDFYQQYIEAISSHKDGAIKDYFAGRQKKEQLALFDEWYINHKDVQKVQMNLKLGKHFVDEKGRIHFYVREEAMLDNKEWDEIVEKDTVRSYKVCLDYETTVNLLEADWKIVERKILQSMVAVQDEDGKWVQY